MVARMGSSVLTHEVQRVQDEISQVFSFDNRIEHPMLEQELRALKALRQLLFYGLLNHAGSCKPDLCAGFGYVEIAQHREAGRHSAGRRVSEHRYEWKPGFIQPRKRRRYFRHLHERDCAFLHPRSAGSREKTAPRRGWSQSPIA